MPNERILVVEDEGIVAADLVSVLTRLGYTVVGAAATGEDAIRKAEEHTPDLVLMDIRLKGDMDGIEAAEHIVTEMGIPVTYLTAYADDSTLERAKVTLPYGYILKPFEERDLRSTIEIALHKHTMNSFFDKMNQWHADTLQSLSDGVVTIDSKKSVTFLNRAAEKLTGWTLSDLYAKNVFSVFKLDASGEKERFHQNIDRVFELGHGAAPDKPVNIVVTNGRTLSISLSTAPIRSREGTISGAVIVFRAAPEGIPAR